MPRRLRSFFCARLAHRGATELAAARPTPAQPFQPPFQPSPSKTRQEGEPERELLCVGDFEGTLYLFQMEMSHKVDDVEGKTRFKNSKLLWKMNATQGSEITKLKHVPELKAIVVASVDKCVRIVGAFPRPRARPLGSQVAVLLVPPPVLLPLSAAAPHIATSPLSSAPSASLPFSCNL